MSSIILSTYTWALTLRDSATSALRGGMDAMKPEDGQDLVEYAVLIGVIAIVATAALIGLGPGGLDVFSVMGDRIAACIKFDTATCAGS